MDKLSHQRDNEPLVCRHVEPYVNKVDRVRGNVMVLNKPDVTPDFYKTLFELRKDSNEND